MTKLTQFSLPVPAGTIISSEYGPRFNKKGQEKVHRGIDFAVVVNTDITSVGSGTVIRTIANHKDYGNVVIVKHADDQATLYAHLNEFKVSEDDPVDESTIIGLSGNTGRSDGPHLHLDLIEGSNYVSSIKNAKDPSIGIYGREGRSNPRQYFDHYTSAEFTATVAPGDSSFGLTSGDSRDNTIYGNSNQNTLEGLGGFDTYYFPSFSGADEVIDSDLDGEISIGGYALNGNANPKTNFLTNEIIPNKWSIDEYDLDRDVDDLVISQPGVSGSIRVTDFPFDSNTRNFGITLGKKMQGYDSLIEAHDDDDYSYSILYALPDTRGRFLTPVFLREDDGVRNYVVKIYDARGNKVSYQAITDVANEYYEDIGTGMRPKITRTVSASGQSYKLDNSNIVWAYAVSELYSDSSGRFTEGRSSAFLAYTDTEGKLISTVGVGDEMVSTISLSHFNGILYSPQFVSRKGVCFSRGGRGDYCGTLDSRLLVLPLIILFIAMMIKIFRI